MTCFKFRPVITLIVAAIILFSTDRIHANQNLAKITSKHTPPQSLEEDADFNIYANLMNVHLLKKLKIVYRSPGQDQYRTKDCNFDEEKNQYSCEVSADDLSADGIQYYLAVIEESGRGYPVFKSASYPHTIRIGQEEDLLFGDETGLEAEFAVFAITDDVIVSAARHAQKLSDAPASVTVITEKDIRLSGLRFFPDLLRKVPGMDVMNMSRSDGNVSARGYNQILSNKTLPLINGRSVYQDFFGATEWSIFSFNFQDIKQIEVIRGPVSALYGANAFTGVVNIITKKPEDETGMRSSVQYGSRNSFLGELSFSEDLGKASYRLSLGVEKKDKWQKYNTHRFITGENPDIINYYDPINYKSNFEDENVSYSGVKFNGQLYFDLGKSEDISFSAGISDSFSNIYTNDLVGLFAREGHFSHFMTEYNRKSTKVRAFWNQLVSRAGRAFSPVGQDDFVFKLASNVVDLEVQHELKVKSFLKQNLILGAGIRYQDIDYELFKKKRDQMTYAAFLQDEIELLEPLVLTLGYRLDLHPRIGQTHAPRANLTYQVSENNTVRSSVAIAYRNPTFLETFSNFDLATYYSVEDPTSSLFFTAQGNEELDPERIISYEFGYVTKPTEDLKFNLDLFYNRVESIISPKPSSIDPESRDANGGFPAGKLNFVNEGERYSFGAELYSEYNLLSWLSINGSYAYVQVVDTETDYRIETSPDHKINLGAQAEHKSGWEFNLDTHIASQTIWEVIYLDLNKRELTELPVKKETNVLINSRIGYKLLKNQLRLELVAYNILGKSYKEHPLGDSIEQTIMLGVEWTPRIKKK